VIALALLLALFLLLAMGAPVAFAMAIAGIAGLYLEGGAPMVLGILSTTPISAVSAYELITIPMFLLMAEMVLASGVADDLYRTAAAWFGRIPGGLAISTTLAGAIFGSICGSSTGSAATLSATSLPAMVRHGYDPRMAAGVVAISGTLAILLPSSIALVLYGHLAEVNMGKLLVSGIIPAVLITATIVTTIRFLVWLDPTKAPPVKSTPWKQRLAMVKGIIPIGLLFGFISSAIYTGITTPTEASAIGAFGAFVMALLRGQLTLRVLLGAMRRAAMSSCMISMILLGASVFSYAFTLTHVTHDLVQAIAGLPVSRWIVIALILACYIVLGSFMDQVAILVLTIPIVLPIIKSLGFDPIWFGVIKVVTAEVGLITPPIGLNCYIVARYANRPVEEIFQGTFPHFVAHLIAIAILVAFPGITLWLQSRM
jgi:tripartite ATP-independent transporter DctM subunit